MPPNVVRIGADPTTEKVMTAQRVLVQDAKRLIDCGAALVDIREADEHVRERDVGARHYALSCVNGPINTDDAPAVIFQCRTGSRTAAAADRLASITGVDAYVLDGGIEAWKAPSLSLVKDRRQPIEITRQVQITAGSLVLLGVVFEALAHPAFYAVAGALGGGLVFAGLTGTCGRTRLLVFAPWNGGSRKAATV